MGFDMATYPTSQRCSWGKTSQSFYSVQSAFRCASFQGPVPRATSMVLCVNAKKRGPVSPISFGFVDRSFHSDILDPLQ